MCVVSYVGILDALELENLEDDRDKFSFAFTSSERDEILRFLSGLEILYNEGGASWEIYVACNNATFTRQVAYFYR